MADENNSPGRPLKLYRLYHIDEGGGIHAVSVIEASENAQAFNQAQALLQTSTGELWLDDQLTSAVNRPRQ